MFCDFKNIVGNECVTRDLFICPGVVELARYYFRELADHWFRNYRAAVFRYYMAPYLAVRKIAPIQRRIGCEMRK